MSETPRYLHKKGYIKKLYTTLRRTAWFNNRNISKKNLMRMIAGERGTEIIQKKADIRVRLIPKKNEDNNSSSKKISILSSKYLIICLIMSLQGGSLYMMFYGMSTDVQSLGLNSINANGIFLGATQAVGYLIVIPFIHHMKRRYWSLIFQALQAICVVILLVLSFFPSISYIRLAETLVSTCGIAVIMSSQYALFFLYAAELFPTEIRGVGLAITISSSRFIGAGAPFLGKLSKDLGFHLLVGCGLIFLLSLPLSMLLSETLQEKVVKQKEEVLETGDSNEESEVGSSELLVSDYSNK